MLSYAMIQLIKCFGCLIWLTIKYMYLGYYYILHGARLTDCLEPQTDGL